MSQINQQAIDINTPAQVTGIMPGAAEHYARQGFEIIPLNWIVAPAPADAVAAARAASPESVVRELKAAARLAVCSCGQVGCKSPGKHPLTRHGVDDATADLAQVQAWWSQWPQANIGIRVSRNTLVLDFDWKCANALETWGAFQRRGLPTTWVNASGYGCHVWLSIPDALESLPASFPGGDILHHNHRFAIAPPSQHWTGVLYKTETNVPIARAPQWLVDALPTWRGLTRARGVERLLEGQPASAANSLSWLRVRRDLHRPPNTPPLDWFRELCGKVLEPAIFDGDPRSTEPASITLQRAACHGLRGLELDQTDVYETLRDYYAPRCLPEPWDLATPHRAREFERLVRTAGKYASDGYLQPDASTLTLQLQAQRGAVGVAKAELREAKSSGDETCIATASAKLSAAEKAVGQTQQEIAAAKARASKAEAPEGLIVVEDTSFKGLAEAFLRHRHPADDLRAWRGEYYRWTGTHYGQQDTDALKHEIGRFLHAALNPVPDSMRNINDIFAALPRADGFKVYVQNDKEPHSGVRACANGVLDLATGTLLPHDASRWVLSASPWAWTPTMATPNWDAFLQSLKFDPVGLQCLREAMGFLAFGPGKFQKIVLLVGARRGGKGTILQLLNNMVGKTSSAALTDLATDFGLAGAIGADLISMGDVQADKGTPFQSQARIVERLVSVSGRDRVQINRKGREQWDGVLDARIVMACNKVPALKDPGGALRGRYVVIPFHQSFQGREDLALFDRLRPELPGIAAWALAGWKTLCERGQFVEAEGAAEVRGVLDGCGSPIEAFVTEACTLGTELTVERSQLYGAYTGWAGTNGQSPASMQQFGAELGAMQLTGFKWDYRPRANNPALKRLVKGLRLN
jgi:putative DNA primase/helicase